MPVTYRPKLGSVLMCDFRGMVPPEIVKERPVVVVSPDHVYRHDLVAVVPISTSEARKEADHRVRLSKNYRPDEPDDLPCWATCDLVMSVSLRRLERFKVGRKKWFSPDFLEPDLIAVRRGIAAAFGLGMKE